MKCRHCGVDIIPTVLESLWHEAGNTEKLFPQYCRNKDTLHEPEETGVEESKEQQSMNLTENGE